MFGFFFYFQSSHLIKILCCTLKCRPTYSNINRLNFITIGVNMKSDSDRFLCVSQQMICCQTLTVCLKITLCFIDMHVNRLATQLRLHSKSAKVCVAFIDATHDKSKPAEIATYKIQKKKLLLIIVRIVRFLSDLTPLQLSTIKCCLQSI